MSAYPDVKSFKQLEIKGHKQRPNVYMFFVGDQKIILQCGARSIQLYSGFMGTVSYEATNRLNIRMDFAKVSRQDDIMVITQELETCGGVTTAGVREFVRTFLASRILAEKFLTKEPTFRKTK